MEVHVEFVIVDYGLEVLTVREKWKLHIPVALSSNLGVQGVDRFFSSSWVSLWLSVFLSVAINVAVPATGVGPTAEVVLRIEGATSKIFEGVIVTEGHTVTSATGGTHHCDGTNPMPGPTPTTALDDAARLKGFTWDGTYFAEFDDCFVTRIEDSIQTSTKFWGLLVGYQFTPVGGCQFQVKNGDEILWAYDAFNKNYFLKLTGPSQANKNKPFQLTVTNGSGGAPVAGAVVSAGAGE